MRILIGIVALSLSGCATITNVISPPYVPQTIRVNDVIKYSADMAECTKAAAAFVSKPSIGSAATKVVDGATSNASMIPLSPWVPVAGAAGGVIRAAGDAIGVAGGARANVYRNCLHDETMLDGSAVLANPN